MKNITELRDSIISDRERYGKTKSQLPLLKERTTAANAVLGTLKVELSYHALRKEAPSIPFIQDAKRGKPRSK